MQRAAGSTKILLRFSCAHICNMQIPVDSRWMNGCALCSETSMIQKSKDKQKNVVRKKENCKSRSFARELKRISVTLHTFCILRKSVIISLESQKKAIRDYCCSWIAWRWCTDIRRNCCVGHWGRCNWLKSRTKWTNEKSPIVVLFMDC